MLELENNKGKHYIAKDINICFLIGKIVTNIDFNFFYNSKEHISNVSFFIENSKSKGLIKIEAYDNLADIIYRKFDKEDVIKIMGKLRMNFVEIVEIEL